MKTTLKETANFVKTVFLFVGAMAIIIEVIGDAVDMFRNMKLGDNQPSVFQRIANNLYVRFRVGLHFLHGVFFPTHNEYSFDELGKKFDFE